MAFVIASKPWCSHMKPASCGLGLLTLEVAERVFLRDEERALVVLEELKEIGVKLALDDFGTVARVSRHAAD